MTDDSVRSDVFGREISLYNGVNPSVVGKATVGDALEAITNSKYAERIERLRTLDPKSYQRAKRKLPGCTWSGTFKSRRNKDLVEHSGLICLDFDNLGDGLDKARKTLAADPHTVAVFKSPSGNGLKWLVSIDPHRHQQSFHSIQDYALRQLGLQADTTPDVSRLCFMSFDPDLFVAPEPEPFIAIDPPSSGHVRSNGKTEGSDPLRTRAGVVAMCRAHAERFGRPTYLDWVKIIAAAIDGIGPAGIDAVQLVWPDEKPGETERKGGAERLKDIKFGTLVTFAKRAGFNPREWIAKRRLSKGDAQPDPSEGDTQPDPSEGDAQSHLGIGDAQPDPSEVGVVHDVYNVDPRGTIDAATLLSLTLPPVQYIVDGLLPEGLAVLAGRPKTGKSWLALNVAIDVSHGLRALGNRETNKCKVLYLAFEDSPGRIQSRIRKISEARGLKIEHDRLLVNTNWKSMKDGGLDDLRNHLAEDHDIRLVIADTFKRFRGREPKMGRSYDNDYDELVMLQKLRIETGTSTLLVHHTTKFKYDDPFDSILGTTGITGACDTMLVLARDTNGTHVLHVRGRDIDDAELALRFDRDSGYFTGGPDAITARLSPERQRILASMDPGVEYGPKKLSLRSGVDANTVRKVLPKLIDDSLVVKKGRGIYVKSEELENGVHMVHNGHTERNGNDKPDTLNGGTTYSDSSQYPPVVH